MLPLALIVVAVVTVVFTLWPVLTGTTRRFETSHMDTPTGRLEQRKNIVLRNITDLDFEFAMGKMAEGDHTSMRDALKRQAGSILEQLEVLKQGDAVATARPANRPAHASNDATTGPSAAFCVHCGQKLPTVARFCSGCGEKVVS